jgi:predicted  nucleic acid-binding Zn-ribbon protein
LERVFAGFQIDNDFYVMLFLFLLITVVISTIIVVFVSKIQTLTAILERAKEIDQAKEERLSFLDEALTTEKIRNVKLIEEIKYLENGKKKFQNFEQVTTRLQEQIIRQEKEHVDELHLQKKFLDELTIHHKIAIDQLEKLEEELFLIKKFQENLKEKNSLLYTKKRELEIKLSEQQKQTAEKMRMMAEHRGDLKEEFSELASKIFEGNSKELTSAL